MRNAAAVDVSRYYGITIVTCVPFDPESKGGSESTVKVAKADLVPTEYNLLDELQLFSELEAACTEVWPSSTAGPTGHPAGARRDARGGTQPISTRSPMRPTPPPSGSPGRSAGPRRVVPGARYSVPEPGRCPVWVRAVAGEVVIIAGEGSRATEVARHDQVAAGTGVDQRRALPGALEPPPRLGRRGRPRSPRRPSWRSAKAPRSTWSKQPPSVPGASRPAWPRRSPWPPCTGDVVDRALGMAAMAGRFSEGDLESIIVHASGGPVGRPVPPPSTPSPAAPRVVGLRCHRGGGVMTARPRPPSTRW